MTATMRHDGPHGTERDADHAADPYDLLLAAGICRRCGGPCSWPPDPPTPRPAEGWLTVRVELRNDDGDRAELYASGPDVDAAVDMAEEAQRAADDDPSWVMTEWSAA